MFKRTTAIDKLLKLNKRVKVIPGGTSAGKTYGILPILINKAATTPNLQISVVSESIPHLRRGAIKDFLEIMEDTKRFIPKRWNKTHLTYTFGNGSYIEFFSCDQPDKVRGPRRHILYVNEANNVRWESYLQLAIRTSQEIWMDFNPTLEFWVHTKLKDDKDVDWLTLTYKDNEGLPNSLVQEIEKALPKGFHRPNAKDLFHEDNIKSVYWSNWWKVYGLGMLGVLEGVILSDYEIVDSLPQWAEYLGSGIDFGYTNDPTACMDAYKFNGKIYWDQSIYQKGMLNGQIARRLLQQDKDETTDIIAESAEPKSIDEINTYGLSLTAVEKGADSIAFGIDLMQQETFYITKRSVDAINELRKYCWDSDKTGKTLPKPIDAYNHCIDAMRYFYMMKLANKSYVDTTASDEALQRARELFN